MATAKKQPVKKAVVKKQAAKKVTAKKASAKKEITPEAREKEILKSKKVFELSFVGHERGIVVKGNAAVPHLIEIHNTVQEMIGQRISQMAQKAIVSGVKKIAAKKSPAKKK